MDWLEFGQLHARIRKAQLPGYSLHYDEGSDRWSADISLGNGTYATIREHSSSVFLEAVHDALERVGA